MTTTPPVPQVDVVGQNANRSRGHIALGVPGQAATATFVDLGPVLRFWSYESGELTPAAARNLAAELTRWADHKEATR